MKFSDLELAAIIRLGKSMADADGKVEQEEIAVSLSLWHFFVKFFCKTNK